MNLDEFRVLHRGQAAVSSLVWTVHARTRTFELGFTAAEVEECVLQSEQSYPSHPSYGRDRCTYQRGDLAVILHEPTKRVVTVLLRTSRRWEHGHDRRTAA